ncbi:MAG: YdeI family protein [Chitinophagales bacterium]
MPAIELKSFYAKDRKAWREWLEKNHVKSPGIWLIYYKKTSGKKRLEYNDAVEEALCFGWIDSTTRPLNEEKYLQRFTPRKPKSGWSKLNKQRIERMMEQDLMTKAGLEIIEIAKKNESWESLDKIYAPIEHLLIPDDLARAFSKNKKARINFENFPVFTRRQFLYWINSAKRDETRKARVKLAVLMCAANKKPGIKGFKL